MCVVDGMGGLHIVLLRVVCTRGCSERAAGMYRSVSLSASRTLFTRSPHSCVHFNTDREDSDEYHRDGYELRIEAAIYDVHLQGVP